MKIGIITFWQTRDNYGQLLQSFALQQVLLQLGHSPYLIRYTHSEVNYSLIDRLCYFFRSLLRLKFRNLVLRTKHLSPLSTHDKNRDFDSFKENNIFFSKTIYHSLSELKSYPPEADCYIVGSDQVWAKNLAYKENEVFYLNFGNKDKKRIAYAASFAMSSYPIAHRKKLMENLKRIDYISVREQSGVDICDNVGFRADVVLDPTLLLSGSYYLSKFNIIKQKTKELFIYCLNISSDDDIYFDKIKEISKNNGYNIVVTPSGGYISAVELFIDVDYRYLTPEKWIEQIFNSSLVVTTSFHGIMFCLLMHTPFLYVPLKGRFSRGNNRVLDILSQLNLKDRIFEGFWDKPFELTNIDWVYVDYKLRDMRQKSINFLNESICKCSKF